MLVSNKKFMYLHEMPDLDFCPYKKFLNLSSYACKSLWFYLVASAPPYQMSGTHPQNIR